MDWSEKPPQCFFLNICSPLGQTAVRKMVKESRSRPGSPKGVLELPQITRLRSRSAGNIKEKLTVPRNVRKNNGPGLVQSSVNQETDVKLPPIVRLPDNQTRLDTPVIVLPE